MEKGITPAEAARRLGVTVGRVHQLIRDKVLPAEKFSRVYIISPADLPKAKNRPDGRGRPAKTKGK